MTNRPTARQTRLHFQNERFRGDKRGKEVMREMHNDFPETGFFFNQESKIQGKTITSKKKRKEMENAN